MRWDGKVATVFVLNETDENKAMQALLLTHPIEEAGSPSDREIDANQKPVVALPFIVKKFTRGAKICL